MSASSFRAPRPESSALRGSAAPSRNVGGAFGDDERDAGVEDGDVAIGVLRARPARRAGLWRYAPDRRRRAPGPWRAAGPGVLRRDFEGADRAVFERDDMR